MATNLASDGGDGQQHLVLFSNDDFAANAQSIAFGTLFPNTNEADLISDLEENAQGVFDSNALFDFAGGDAVGGPNGTVAFTPGDSFTEVAFSDGQIIGGGVSFESATPGGSPLISAAPEPSTWLLMLAGVGGVGLMLRRARTTVDARVGQALAG